MKIQQSYFFFSRLNFDCSISYGKDEAISHYHESDSVSCLTKEMIPCFKLDRFILYLLVQFSVTLTVA